MGRREGKFGMRNYLVLHRILGEANKGLGEAPKSCTRKEHESATNSIAKRGQGAIAPCRVKGQRPLWGLGQRPNCSASDQSQGSRQQRCRQRSVPASNFARPQTRPQAALPPRFREEPRNARLAGGAVGRRVGFMNLLVVTADLIRISGARSSLSGLHLFNHLQHALCAIGRRGVFDGGGQFVALRPRLHQGVGQGLRGHVFL